ncbi:uncharacterized protein LAJ45_02742 [Morchella importuna]|uniref:uncharacterized protein n=1 Tax=Morchella importuna TaxID=1174673 RepID=UPI001E8D546F|nr:uncharacterized protein LAJ45_02742 [Morchella importuna]KAH8153155.1 hypothetical protein LAJ45_02742 [Morchella importuna]
MGNHKKPVPVYLKSNLLEILPRWKEQGRYCTASVSTVKRSHLLSSFPLSQHLGRPQLSFSFLTYENHPNPKRALVAWGNICGLSLIERNFKHNKIPIIELSKQRGKETDEGELLNFDTGIKLSAASRDSHNIASAFAAATSTERV